MMLETWVFTVPISMNSCSAISALLLPSASAASTSRSRGVRSASADSRAAGARRRANSLITRRVTAGATSPSPVAAARTASMICVGGASLSRKPMAPFSRAPNTYSSRSNVVMTTTGIGSVASGPASVAVAVMPSPAGILTSMSTTSGRRILACVTASGPLDASEITLISGWVSRNVRKARRTLGWSSAMSTVIIDSPPLRCAGAARSARAPSHRSYQFRLLQIH